MVGACSWALIGHRWSEPDAGQSALYAFVATRIGDLGLFIAAMALYAATGGFAFANISNIDGATLEIVALGVIIAAAGKSGQIPFAPWLFRAMAGPTSVSALLHAATMVAAGAYILIRLEPHLAPAALFAPVTIAVGVTTALCGGLVGLLQSHAKKVLAASTSAHYGLMLVATGAGFPGVALLHLIVHAAFKALLFLATGVAHAQAGTFVLHRLGVGRLVPASAAMALIGALALAGVPPLGAAWTKEQIVAAGEHAQWWLGPVVMLAGALSAAYAARLFVLAFGRWRSERAPAPPSATEQAALTLLAMASVLLGLLWFPPVNATAAAIISAKMPSGTLVGMSASLILISVGLVFGLLLAHRMPKLGTSGVPERAADWLALPHVLDRVIVRPCASLARRAARIDDGVFDALPRQAARGAGYTASGLARQEARLVDGAIDRAERMTRLLAELLDRSAPTRYATGEDLADDLPEGLARLSGNLAHNARRLQTGMSHHYYALLVGGTAAAILFLIVMV